MCERCATTECAYAPKGCPNTGVQSISIKGDTPLVLCDTHLQYVAQHVTAAQYN